ncbi:alpha/beta fold hydrolase [Amnibacterium setariae]|uniref:Alpha/beta fold hydrolase n=1 Tax=Amnibacterium setariae TaxID=2306585 RepID=A0A3A1TXR4_9MICO|nr:alpha/beta fold hydrolase [Amnibacterium setariae]RIX28361.1 alpha/beta fold hydrolase [Amnibacterium setariae]
MTAAATLPPALPGLDPAWSRLVRVHDAVLGREVVHHVLDTEGALVAAGAEPVGTILAVHGNPTWSYLWRALADESIERARAGAPAWRVVAVDQLEMGWSERTDAVRRVADRVRDLGALTEALGLEGPVVALGHDWGGVIVSGWALEHPDLLAGLVLTNTAVDGHAALPAALKAALAASSVGTEHTTAFLDTTLAIAHPRLDPAVRRAFRSPYRGAARRQGIREFVADIPSTDAHPSREAVDRIAAGLAALAAPALLLWGPRDPVFQERYLHDLMRRLPHAAVHRFEGAGHLLPEDADVAGAVLDWVVAPTPARSAPGAVVPAVETRAMWAELDARADDDAPALVELHGDDTRTISWRLLARRVHELAAGLHAIGVQRGDRVSLLVPPGADLTAALYACLRIGAVVVVADAGLGVQGLTRAVKGARPSWIIGIPTALAAARSLGWPGTRIAPTGLSRLARAALGVEHTLPELARLGSGRALPPEPAPETLAAVLFTSGSTGPAKGVRYTHARLAGVRDALVAQYGIDRGTGLVAGFAPFALLGPTLGCRTAVPDMDVTRPATLTAAGLARAVAAIDADAVFLSPAALTNVLATDPDPAEFDGVRLLLTVGAPVAAPLLDRAQEVLRNASLRTPYGMTETLLVADVTREAIHEAGEGDGVCVGPPTARAQVRIAPLDDDGRPGAATTTDADVTGEIQVHAPHMLAGYDRLWRTDAAAKAGTPHEEWHRTGDVGHLDAQGRLWVEGRLPHVVTTADGVVTPVGVELAAQRAGASRAAAVGVGPRGTQQLVVIVEGQAGPLADPALAAAVRLEVDRPVAAVLAVPELPTDIRHNAKIDRARMARWATGVLEGGPVTTP